MTFVYGETVTRLRASATKTDPYSTTEVPDWDQTPDGLDLDGWGVDDSKSAEPLADARQAVITDFVLYRDEPADVLPDDRVVVRGFTCEVVGRPATWRNPFSGWEAGFVVQANIVEG